MSILFNCVSPLHTLPLHVPASLEYEYICNQEISSGYIFKGFLTLHGGNLKKLEEKLTNLGSVTDLQHVIENYGIEEIIIVLDKADENEIYSIIFSVQEPNV